MDLFNRKKKEVTRDFEFSNEKLHKNLEKLKAELYDDRKSSSHHVFVKFIKSLRDKELLNFAHPRDVSKEAYDYNRGRLDSLSNVLKTYDIFIADMQTAKSKESKADNKEARSYLSKPKPNPPQQAGLSI